MSHPSLCEACRHNPAFVLIGEAALCSLCASSLTDFELPGDGARKNSSTLRVTAASESRSKSSFSLSLFMLRLCGVCVCPNHNSGQRARPVPNREQPFPPVHQNPETTLPSWRARFGRAKPQLSWPGAPTSPSAPPNSGCPETANRPSTSSWSLSTECAGAVATSWSGI